MRRKPKKSYKLYVDLQIPAKDFFDIMSSLSTDKPKLNLLIKGDDKPKSLNKKGVKKLKNRFDSIVQKIPAGFFDTEMASRSAKVNFLVTKGILAHMQGDKRELGSIKNQIGRLEYKMRLKKESQEGQKEFSYIDSCIYFEQVLKRPIDPYGISIEQYISIQNLATETSQRIESNAKRN